jgi:hypothetical protein
MSPLNRGSSHRIPISILLCHTGRPGVIAAVDVPNRSRLMGFTAPDACIFCIKQCSQFLQRFHLEYIQYKVNYVLNGEHSKPILFF